MRRILWLALALALSAGTALASWADLFEKGKTAVEEGSYSQGRDLLLQALQEKGEEGRVRIGMKSWDYYPSHYLAKAYMGLGQLDDAEKYLKRAEAVKDQSAGERALLGDLRRQFEQARRAAVAQPPAAQPVAPAAPAAPAAPSAQAQLAKKAFADGEVGTARRLAEAALAENPKDADAKEVLESARAYTKAKVGAARDALAAEDLAAAEGAVRDAIKSDPQNAEALALRDEIKAKRATAVAAAPASPAAPPRPATAPTGRVAELPPPVAPPRGATGAVAPPVTPAQAAPAGRDAAMQPAYEQFFRGEIQASIAALEAATAGGGSAESLAVLGAAHATQGLLAGDAGTKEMSTARALFKQALQKDARVRLDRRWFSPLIVEVFESVRSGG